MILKFLHLPAAGALLLGLAACSGASTPIATNSGITPQSQRICTTLQAPLTGADDTTTIQGAITSCAASGGGTVSLSGGGTFLSGPLVLASNTFLLVDTNTTLKAVSDQTRFVPAVITQPYRANEAFVSANGASNVGILGNGTIDGSGAPYWAQATAFSASGATSYPGFPGLPTSNGLPRPWLVEFWQCNNVTVNSIHLQNSPMWDAVFRYSSNVFVNGLSVLNPATTAPNTDGVDVVSSNTVNLTNLNISTGDDDVAIKSGLPNNNVPAVATQNVTVTNSTLLNGHGLSIGSETINGVQHVTVNGITFNGTQNGIRLKTGRDRGNQLNDWNYNNLTMTNVGTPISFSAYYPSIPADGTDTAQPITATTPFVHDITIQNLTATGATGQSLFVGLPESPILGITMNNVNITQTKGSGMELRNVSGTFTNVTVTPASGTPFVVQENVSITGETL